MTTPMIAPARPSTEGTTTDPTIDAGLEGGWDAASAPLAPILDPAGIERELAARNLQLAREPEVSEDLRLYLAQLADDVSALSNEAPGAIDPYLLLAANGALIRALRVLDTGDVRRERREMRTNLEQMRQVFRDIAEGGPLYQDRPAKEIAQWLASALETSQASLAELLGVSTRTFQRWLSEESAGGPDGEDARRVRVVARVANHLRHALTGPGVVRWFDQPHPQLDGRRPLELLDDPAAAERLATLAAGARSNLAA